MPTPLIYRGLLYVLNNNGYFEAYDLASGTELYSHRIPHRGSGFSASPVAADGWIYLPSEDGEVFVVRAGKEFRLDGQHDVGELLMATPALSEGRMYIRAQGNLFAIGR
jgi:outer membrane protein assembly factor BamB